MSSSNKLVVQPIDNDDTSQDTCNNNPAPGFHRRPRFSIPTHYQFSSPHLLGDPPTTCACSTLHIEFRPGQKGLCLLRSYAPEPDTKVYDSDPGELGYYIVGGFRTPIQSRWMASVIEMGDIITDHVKQRQALNNPLMLSELDALLLPAKPDAFGQGDWHCFIGQEVSQIMMEGQDDGDFRLTMRPVTQREEKPRRWPRDF